MALACRDRGKSRIASSCSETWLKSAKSRQLIYVAPRLQGKSWDTLQALAMFFRYLTPSSDYPRDGLEPRHVQLRTVYMSVRR
jgi:hypothetical protein